jgi:AAA+ ATPase superfamily predicted ATPase
MAHKMLHNPFPVGTYQGSEYFCDRQNETARLIENIRSGNSTSLIAIRRIGKTGLLQHTLNQLPNDIKGIYIDILETESLSGFLNKLATSLLHSAPEKSSFGKKIWSIIRNIRPVISFDALTGAPQASFDLKQNDVEMNIDTIFQFLDQQSFKTVIVIDEFQQITTYPERNTDAWLRTRMQQMRNVVFIFSGSQQHLMTELFTSPNRPFFRSASMLKLEKLDFETYRGFIVMQFNRFHKEISPELTADILHWGNVHTYYIQQICNRVFAATPRQVTENLWKQQAYELLKEQEIVFFNYRNLLTNHQWQLLKAIAREDKVYHPSGRQFMTKYGLPSSASVLRSLEALIRYQLVYTDFHSEKGLYYSVYDVFFQRWCNEISIY